MNLKNIFSGEMVTPSTDYAVYYALCECVLKFFFGSVTRFGEILPLLQIFINLFLIVEGLLFSV